jgi:hypothetical protein
VDKNTSMTVNKSAIAGFTDKVESTETEAIES